jgi:hypothetical protein
MSLKEAEIRFPYCRLQYRFLVKLLSCLNRSAGLKAKAKLGDIAGQAALPICGLFYCFFSDIGDLNVENVSPVRGQKQRSTSSKPV